MCSLIEKSQAERNLIAAVLWPEGKRARGRSRDIEIDWRQSERERERERAREVKERRGR